jgi:acetylcholinesterase
LYTQYSWGESAGGFSINAHLATTPVNPPFRAAIIVCLSNPRTSFDIANNPIRFQHSGYMAPLYKTDHPKYQAIYDHLVEFAGCTSAPDTLECLRVAPYAALKDAVDTTPSLFSLSGVDFTWGISVDGDLVEKTLRQYISEGSYARVPILGGQVDDEGT